LLTALPIRKPISLAVANTRSLSTRVFGLFGLQGVTRHRLEVVRCRDQPVDPGPDGVFISDKPCALEAAITESARMTRRFSCSGSAVVANRQPAARGVEPRIGFP
jgi:hypothetical protein